MLRTPRQPCIQPRFGLNVLLAGEPRFVPKLHRPRPGGRLPARAIYAGPDSADAMRRAKETAFETLRAEYDALRQSGNGVGNHDAWFSRPLNNAHIASVATYEYWAPGLRWLLEMNGLDAFYEEVEALGGLDPDERRLRLQDWRERASEIVDSYGAGS